MPARNNIEHSSPEVGLALLFKIRYHESTSRSCQFQLRLSTSIERSLLQKINKVQCSPEDVINKEQHILPLLVAEILGYSQSCQGNTGTGA